MYLKTPNIWSQNEQRFLSNVSYKDKLEKRQENNWNRAVYTIPLKTIFLFVSEFAAGIDIKQDTILLSWKFFRSILSADLFQLLENLAVGFRLGVSDVVQQLAVIFQTDFEGFVKCGEYLFLGSKRPVLVLKAAFEVCCA